MIGYSFILITLDTETQSVCW